MAYTYKTLATYQQNGPIVKQLGPSQIAALSANFVFDYNNFLQIAINDVNLAIRSAERSAGQNAQIELIMPNLHGQAGTIATKLNQQVAQGKITYNGEVIAPWPGYQQIAFAQDSDTLVVRWVNKFLAWYYIVIMVLVAILGLALYELFRGTPYTMRQALTQTGSGGGGGGGSGTGTNGQGTGLPSSGSILAAVIRNWPLVLLGGGALVAAPFVISHVASTESSLNRLHAAERQGRGGR